MALEETKVTEDIRSTDELNKFLQKGWVLIMTYVDDVGELGAPSGRPHFVVAWQSESPPEYPTSFRHPPELKFKKVIGNMAS
jgi:hypothetical protein